MSKDQKGFLISIAFIGYLLGNMWLLLMSLTTGDHTYANISFVLIVLGLFAIFKSLGNKKS